LGFLDRHQGNKKLRARPQMTASQNDTGSTARVGNARLGISPWQLVVATLFIVAIGIAPSLAMIWPKWTGTQTYSHGLLIVLLSAWLLWRQRDRINATEARMFPLAGIVLFGLLMGSALAYAASIEIGTETLMPLTLLAGVLFVAGVGISKIVAFPVLLLYAAVSIWDVINGTLQAWTTSAVTVILKTLRVPSYIEGNFVQIPSGVFEIAGGCSGLHFFIIAVTLASVYSHMYLQTWKRSLQLVAIMGAMSIVMNWIRVATIIIAGYLTEMQSYLVKVDHYSFGWVLFVFMLVPFFLIARRIEVKDRQGDSAAEQRAALPPTQTGLAPLIVVSAIVLMPVFAWGRVMLHSGQPVDISLPVIAGFDGPAEFEGEWEPVFPGAAGEVMGTYRAGGVEIDVYVNWFDGQSQGQELIGYRTSLAGKQWKTLNDRVHIDSAQASHGKGLEIGEIIAESNRGQRRIIQYYYVVGDYTAVNPIETKLRQGLRSLSAQFGSGLVAWSVACDATDNNCEAARGKLSSGTGLAESGLFEALVSLKKPVQTPAEELEVEE
jgi:EpsI family protein